MIDLEKLNSQIDLKNIDPAKIISALAGHQNNLIKIVLIAGSLFAAWLMFNQYHGKEQSLHLQLSQLQQKIGVIKARNASNEDLNNFRSALPPKINEFDLITLLSNYVKLHHVTITSLSPAESKDMGLYDVINVKFVGQAYDFKSLMFFLREIEESKSSLMINSWSGHEEENGKIDFTISISAVVIKE